MIDRAENLLQENDRFYLIEMRVLVQPQLKIHLSLKNLVHRTLIFIQRMNLLNLTAVQEDHPH